MHARLVREHGLERSVARRGLDAPEQRAERDEIARREPEQPAHDDHAARRVERAPHGRNERGVGRFERGAEPRDAHRRELEREARALIGGLAPADLEAEGRCYWLHGPL